MGSSAAARVVLILLVLCVRHAKSSHIDSNLASAGTNGNSFDLVVGVTQESVQRTMTDFLRNISTSGPFRQIYKFNPHAGLDGDQFIPVDYHETVQKLSFDPFTLPNNLPQHDPRIQKMLQNFIVLGFEAEFGIPPGVPDHRLPKPISFDQSGSVVTYNMINKEFKVFELQVGFVTRFVSTTQSEYLAENENNLPWTFRFSVDLDLRTDSATNKFHLLPKQTQDRIKNLGPNAFSIDQLFLNLNAAKLQNEQPQIPTLPPSTRFNLLHKVFLDLYINSIDSGEDGILLGYTVKIDRRSPKKATFTPTDLNFHISPHYHANGSASDDFGLYTLNYLMSSGDRTLSSPVDFGWNWVDAKDRSKYDGVISVRRNVFGSFLKDNLSPELGILCQQPHVDVDIDDPVFADFRWGTTQCRDPQHYTLHTGATQKVLSYNFEQQAKDDDFFFPIYADMRMKVTSSSEVFLIANQVRTVSSIKVFARVNVVGGVTSGNIVHYRTTTNYVLGVDRAGQITATLAKGSPLFEDLSESVNPNVWAQIASFGTFKNLLDSLKRKLRSRMTTYLSGFQRRIAAALNTESSWIFPGGNTFAFVDVSFSNYQDLVSHIKYLKPASSA